MSSEQTTEITPPKVETKPKLTIKKPPVLVSKTQSELKKLSKLLDCPVLSYYKPANGNIWSQDLYAILECLKSIGKVKKLGLYIRSNGGNGMVSLRMIHLLRSFCDELILLAPSECASAATMLALGCNQIYMGPLSSLSPVDSSLTHALSPVDKVNNSVSVSLDELSRVIRLWKEADEKRVVKTDENDKNSDDKNLVENPYKYLYEYIHPLVFGAVDRHSSLSIRLCEEILSYHLKDKKKIEKISHSLNYDYPAHGYPITLHEAQKIGLNVFELSEDCLKIVNGLQLLYSEMTEEKITDYDNANYHDNSIYSVIESSDIQIVYMQNYDKYYREAEKRYIVLNDYSGWFKYSQRSNGNGYNKVKVFF
jgi:hypothetical protein